MKVNSDESALYERRQKIPVLVPEAGASGMLAVIRSLGRAGYQVHACSSDEHAIGLKSAFAAVAVEHPPYEDNEFIDWLRHYINTRNIRYIVPSEGLFIAIRSCYADFEDLLCVSSDKDVVFRCLSKADVATAFSAAPESHPVHLNLPRTLIYNRNSVNFNDEARKLRFPLFAKTDAAHAALGRDGNVTKIKSPNELARVVDRLLKESEKVLVQESATGVKATYNACRIDNEILAESMLLAMHENPHTGGLTALRKTWWNDDMRADAIARLELLNWNGVAMVEYKWCATTNTFKFIELNSRYWAALHLDLFAGTDFPKIQLDAMMGLENNRALGPQKSTVARMTFPADLGYTISLVRDDDTSIGAKLKAIGAFFLGFANPLLKSDFWFPGDRRLYLRQMYASLRRLLLD